MAIDKKLKKKVISMMGVLDIDYEDWLNEQHKKFKEDREDEYDEKAIEMYKLLNQYYKTIKIYKQSTVPI